MILHSLKHALAVLLFSLSLTAFSAWDITQSYIVVDRGSGDELYAGGFNPDAASIHNNLYYGNFQEGGTFILNGAQLRTTESGSSNVCGGTLYYRVYSSCDVAGAFSSLSLPFGADLGGGVEEWEATSSNIDLLSTLDPGTYTLEVYWEAEGNELDPAGCGEFKLDNNAGNYWKGFFDYDQLDSFRDGDFSANPVWSGDTGNWLIVANSDAAAGATGSYTLRLNAPGVAQVDHISTPFTNWLDEQSWSFFFGRRAQGLTAANRIDIWLYANEANLESATVDGYRIRMGDDSGGDEINLESVTNGTGTVILTGPAIANGLTDYGIDFKITRSSTGTWTLFTSAIPAVNGTGAIASSCPLDLATINQGSVTNTLYSIAGSGFFGFAATHTTGGNAIVANEFDQIRIKGEALVFVLGCTDAGACNYDPLATQDDGSCEFLSCAGCTNTYATNYDVTATIEDGSCVFPNIVISEIHYNPDDVAGYTDPDYEFLEIYNNEAFSVDLSGWSLTGITFTFPAATSIAAGEYIVIALNAITYNGNGYQVFQYTGGLNNAGELVQLLTPNSAVVDAVTYDDANPWPINADGSGPSAELFDANLDNNDGNNWFAYTLNGTPGAAPLNIPGCLDPSANNYNIIATVEDGSCTYNSPTVIINELHYNPCIVQGNDTEFEFLELYNASAGSVDISGWEIVGYEFTFPAASTIAAGEYIIVAISPASYTGNGYQVFGPVFGSLVNSGEAISLLDDLGNYIDYVSYGTSSPWPTSPNGNCSSLELGDPNSNNYDVGNWQGSLQGNCTEYGTPGAQNSVIAEGCTDPTALNYDPCVNFEDGSCTYPEGCTNPLACNYDVVAIIDNGTCEFVSCAGCTDVGACNFDGSATIDDGSCGYSCLGCTDAGAYNYDPGATIDDGSCFYAQSINPTLFPNCSGTVSQTTLPGANSGLPNVLGGDADDEVFFVFVAPCNGAIKVDVDGFGINAGIEILDNSYSSLAASDAAGFGGTEIAYASGILVGQTYFVRVYDMGTGVEGGFNICLTAFCASSPEGIYPSLTYQACDVYKCDFISGAAGYNWNVTPQGGGATLTYSSANNNTFLNLSNLIGPVEYGVTYDVVIDVRYTDPDLGPIVVAGVISDVLVMDAAPVSELRSDFVNGNYALNANLRCSQSCGADNYIWRLTPSGGSALPDVTAPGNSTIVNLCNFAGILPGTSYSVEVAVVYGGIQYAFGPANPINTNAQPVVTLRLADNCSNAGPIALGYTIFTSAFVPCAKDWTWEFTRTDVPELPIYWKKGDGVRTLRLNNVKDLNTNIPLLVAGGTYTVRVKPEYGNFLGQGNNVPTLQPQYDFATNYGGVQQICIVGAGVDGGNNEFAGQNTSPVRDASVAIEAAIYPNPTNGSFVNLNINNLDASTDRVLVDIYDAVGKLVMSEQFATTGSTSFNTVISFNGLIANGVYMVNIIAGNTVKAERLVVQK